MLYKRTLSLHFSAQNTVSSRMASVSSGETGRELELHELIQRLRAEYADTLAEICKKMNTFRDTFN